MILIIISYVYPHYFTLHLLVLLCSCWSNHPISPHQAMALLDLAEEVEALRLAEKVRTPLRALNMSKTTSFFREEHAINHHHIYIYILYLLQEEHLWISHVLPRSTTTQYKHLLQRNIAYGSHIGWRFHFFNPSYSG